MKRCFPMAVWYGGGRTRATMVKHPGPRSAEDWRRDIANIKECGFNTVRCWVDWAASEPRPGAYRFDAQELVMDLAREAGLQVIIQLYLDSAPDWLLDEFPDSAYVSQGGDRIISQGSPGYCYDHPGVRRKAEEFMTAVAARVKDREEFFGWDLWSEPHVVQWAYFDYLPQPAVFCYCHYTVRRFREWLKAKYGTIEALNEAWYRTFSSWDVVDAPRFISLMTYTDFIDWQEFILDKIAQDLAWRARTVKAVDPDHIVTSHSDIPCIMTLPMLGQGAPDDWRMAKVVDVWGTSFYPKHVGAKETNDPSLRSAMLCSTRSACSSVGSPFWLGELQGGHGYVGSFAVSATAEDEAQWTWQPISHGAKGLCFYAWYPMTRGYESAGFGLAELDGTPSERARVAGAAGKVVSANMELFLDAMPPKADVAILYNVLANIMWTAMREKSTYIPSRSLAGAYRPLFEENIPADYVHLDEISLGALARYKVLYMPFSIMITREAAQRIAEFVWNGGTVVAEARTGWNDEVGACGEAVPGFGLSAVFGCKEIGALKVDDTVNLVVAEGAAERVPHFRCGERIMGYGIRQALEVTAPSARVLATFEDGAPAVVANTYGKGLAVLAGTYLSFAYEARRHAPTGRFLGSFAENAGVSRPVIVESTAPRGTVEARVLQSKLGTREEAHVLFAFNHGDDPLDARFFVALGTPADAPGGDGARPVSAEDLFTSKRVDVRAHGGRAELSKELGGGEIWVVKISVG
ncbi:MAG: beta-galactosidase [Firmicutes bacterium]|nr:beta-galactosidase [Bacillota bacterium]MDH7495142.1 beta-galactosidase [Bacillota bacterium]